jgi:hypothetical protein
VTRVKNLELKEKMDRWVKFYDKITESRIWELDRRKCKAMAWTILISRAAFRPGVVKFGRYDVQLYRGEVVYTHTMLSQLFGWTDDITYAFLKFLQSENMITVKYFRRKYSIMKILNYDNYQSKITKQDVEPKPIDFVEVSKNDKNTYGSTHGSTHESIGHSQPIEKSTTYKESGQPEYESTQPSINPSPQKTGIVKRVKNQGDTMSFGDALRILKNIKENRIKNDPLYLFFTKNNQNLNEIQMVFDKYLQFEDIKPDTAELALKYFDSRIKTKWRAADGLPIKDLDMDILDFLLNNGFNHLFLRYHNGEFNDTNAAR